MAVLRRESMTSPGGIRGAEGLVTVPKRSCLVWPGLEAETEQAFVCRLADTLCQPPPVAVGLGLRVKPFVARQS